MMSSNYQTLAERDILQNIRFCRQELSLASNFRDIPR